MVSMGATSPELRVPSQDDVYLQQVTSSCHEVVRRLLGPIAALQYSR